MAKHRANRGADQFLNRYFSWMQFNQRVLEEARDPNNPLLERVKFLAITASNLDEFVEVRVAGLMQQAEHGSRETGPDGRTPSEALVELTKQIHEFVEDQYRCWREELLPALESESIRVISLSQLRPEARVHIENFYSKTVEPLLTPVTVDPAHPFPHVLNKALCLAFLIRRMRRGSHIYLGVVTVPRALPRLVRLPSPEGTSEYIFLHDVVHAFAHRLYHGYEILSAAAFRVTRNSNLYLEEEESRTILESVDTQLHLRRKGSAVRLEIEASAKAEIIERLQANFRLAPEGIFRIHGPINLSRISHLYEETSRPDLKYRPFAPRELVLKPGSASIFEQVRGRSVLLHHPYDSYAAVVRFIESAAQDPDVLSIKQTLYRTSENSPIVRALIEAAATKEVAVVVELKARFDEASNIRWAQNLQEAGVQVFHGVVGLKTHCKLALVARREADGQIRRYAHLGTGNYNPSTARFYTDLSLLTSDAHLTSAVHHVFNYLTAHSERPHYTPLFVAPLNLGRSFLGLIHRETAHAKAGRLAFIFAKFNSLLDDKIIEALYRASQAGVRIELLVRGACALRPGVRGLSSRIGVRSVIGRFLEHSRIFVFGNGGNTDVYLGSADWMQRNIYERVEVIFHLREPALCSQILQEVVAPYLADTQKTRVLKSTGQYVRLHAARALTRLRNGRPFNAQQFLIDFTERRENLDSFPSLPPFMKVRPSPTVATKSA
ncbi:MAG TPA: polyphosphate kinase 1 [Candidatus Acidoferrales bacterium]|nr:polyphosphate kinase 1 [Candidatus Acidoferrales bacterium]